VSDQIRESALPEFPRHADLANTDLSAVRNSTAAAKSGAQIDFPV